GVQDVLQEAKRLDITFSKDRCLALLKASLDPLHFLNNAQDDTTLKSRCELALQLLLGYVHGFSKNDLAPIEGLIVTLAAALARAGDSKGLDVLLSTVDGRGVPASTLLLNLVVSSILNKKDTSTGLKGRREAAMLALDFARQLTFLEGTPAEERLRNGPRPDIWAWNKVLSELGKAGMPFEVAAGFISELSLARLEPDIVTFTSLLHSCQTLKDIQSLEVMVDAGVEAASKDLLWWQALFIAYCRIGYPSIAENLISDKLVNVSPATGCLPLEELIHILLESWAAQGRLDKFDQFRVKYFHRDLKDSIRIKATRRTLNAHISAVLNCSTVFKKLRLADRLCSQYRDKGVTGASSTLNLKLRAALVEYSNLPALQYIEDIERFIEILEKKGMEMTIRTYEAIIKSFAAKACRILDKNVNVGELQRKLVFAGMRWFERMLAKDIAPDRQIYLAIMDSFACVLGDVDAVTAWGQKLADMGDENYLVEMSRFLRKAHLRNRDLALAEKCAREAPAPPTPFWEKCKPLSGGGGKG
ncbi:hypothetical protein HDU67_003375, partial [Dinochytrium kinnereticum]